MARREMLGCLRILKRKTVPPTIRWTLQEPLRVREMTQLLPRTLFLETKIILPSSNIQTSGEENTLPVEESPKVLTNHFSTKIKHYYGDETVNYEDISIKADYIAYNVQTRTVFAKGLPDSTGVVKGHPELKEGKNTYTMESVYYNFDTKKAKKF